MGAAAGFVLGAALTVAVFRLRASQVPCPDPDVHELSSADRDAVSGEFAAHTASVRRELGRYADELAGGDGRLREQLRQFEAEV